MSCNVTIAPARFPADLDEIRRLLAGYARELGIDLSFQGFAEEMAGLPGSYTPPGGCLLVAREARDDHPIGLVAVHPLGNGVCEMKRMVVAPEHRGRGIGRQLAEAAVAAAIEAGHVAMRLDTLGRLRPALELYRSMGFVEIPAYRDNPHRDAVYLELELRGEPRSRAKRAPTGRPAPMKMELALTHRCNLDCSYCYAGPKSDRAMTLETACKALDLAFSHPHDQVRIAPFGGEPLLEMALVDAIAEEARQRAVQTGKQVRFTMTTNGTLLTEENLDPLERHRFRLVVSLDGDQPAHDAARRFADGSSSWQATVDGLCRARDRLGTRRTLSVVHPGNVERMGETFDFLTSLGVNQMSFAIDYHARWTEEDVAALRAGFEAATDRAIERFRAGEDVIMRPLHGKISRRLKRGLVLGTRCRFGRGELAVAPSGRLYPCERLIGPDGPEQRQLAIGDVDRGIDLARVTALRTCGNQPPGDCLRCAVMEQCMWWCGCVNHALTGRVDQVGGLLCQTEQIVIAAADRLASTLHAERNGPFMAHYYHDEASRYGLL